MRQVLFALLSAACLQAQQIGFQGTVTDAVTHQPMAGVHITLRAPNTQSEMALQPYGAISRRDGTFSIGQLAPGMYVVGARYNGYFAIPAKTPGESNSTMVTLKSGEDLKDFSIKMTAHAVIARHVADENGDPVTHVPVTAQAADGGSYQADTDDRGQYRIPLPPGKYYVEAMARAFGGAPNMGWLQEIRTDGGHARIFGNTFYPSASGKDSATPVELEPGQSADGIDIRLNSLVSVAISGIVTGLPAGNHDGPPAAYIILSHVPASGSFDSFTRDAVVGSDGKFTIADIAPGRYRISARSLGAPLLQSAPMEVAAENGSVTDLTLALVHGQTLSGTVRIQNGSKQSLPAEKLTVRLESRSPFGQSVGSGVTDDGKFHIDQVFPGKFNLRVSPLSENAYIKSVKLGPDEFPDGSIDLSGGVDGVQIEIVVSPNGGQLEGALVNKEGTPYSESRFAVVMLASEDTSAGGNAEPDVKQVEPGEKFSFTGLRPGKYRLMAVDPSQFPGAGTQALTSLLSTAPEIEVHENDRISKDLQVSATESSDAK
jgi:hypothetical protein